MEVEGDDQNKAGRSVGIGKTETVRQKRKRAAASHLDEFAAASDRRLDTEYELFEPTNEQWADQKPEAREHYLQQAESDFFRIVDDYLSQANEATLLFQKCSKEYQRGRKIMILATGGLAAINVCASFGFVGNVELFKSGATSFSLAQALNAIAALYAGFLTVGGNLQNFLNKKETADNAREMRDILVDRYREYCFKWFYYVDAFSGTALSCTNAGRLYRQLVDNDHALRLRVKDLTAVKARDAKQTVGS